MYLNTITKKYRLLKYPKIMYHFFCVTMVKFSVNKFLKKNIFLEKAKRKHKAVGRIFISNDEFNKRIKEKILSKEPFFCCRYGGNELTACFFAMMKERGVIDGLNAEQLKKWKTSSGVFPEKEDIVMSYTKKYREAMQWADFNAYMGSFLMEEYIINTFIKKDCVQYAMRALEPFQYDEPWTWALKEKKVLVVHPFSDLIEEQYKKRNEIFPDKEILPEFELVTVRAIQSSGETVPEDYKDWIEASEALYNKCMEKDFEVALVACGSYAVPLAARLKAAGKKVIIPGGMMQLMFGIKGTRWEESRPDIVAMYNDAWVRAGKEYQVKDSDKMVDGPAYW